MSNMETPNKAIYDDYSAITALKRIEHHLFFFWFVDKLVQDMETPNKAMYDDYSAITALKRIENHLFFWFVNKSVTWKFQIRQFMTIKALSQRLSGLKFICLFQLIDDLIGKTKFQRWCQPVLIVPRPPQLRLFIEQPDVARNLALEANRSPK